LQGGSSSIAFSYQTAPAPVNYPNLFVYPYLATGQYYSASPGKYIIFFIKDNVKIGGNYYNSVAEIYHTDDQSTFGDFFYINTDIGIIKMTLFHPLDSINIHLELMRYKIYR
jgi:hypothetical protein